MINRIILLLQILIPGAICQDNGFQFEEDDPKNAGVVFQITIGEDNRQRIPDTSIFPFRAIGKLVNGCTGTLISRRHVITAAHCLRDPIRSSRIFDLQFVPGRDVEFDPFGIIDWEEAIVPAEWSLDVEFSERRLYDYGLIKLAEEVPEGIGAFDFQGALDCNRNFYVMNVAGYPDDKSPQDSQWVSICRGTEVNCTSLSYSHTCDTFFGMSGSPMWVFRPNSPIQHILIGVHSAGDASVQENYGITLNDDVVNTIKRWMNNSFNENDQRIGKPLNVLTTGIADLDCPLQTEGLSINFQLGVCLNSMRANPELYAATDPCGWTAAAVPVTELAFDEVLQDLAEEHAAFNAAILNATSKTLSDGLLPEERLKLLGYQWASGSLLTTIQAGPGRGGAWGVSSGWMCIPARSVQARSCGFDRLGVGVSFSEVDLNYYVVMYQACSREGGCICT